MNLVFAADEPLAELHAHLGGGVDAATMWELADEQGIKLPYRDYWEFAAATNVGAGTDGLPGLDRIYHLTELIQSSPEGVFRAVHGMISGGTARTASRPTRCASTRPSATAAGEGPRRDRDGSGTASTARRWSTRCARG